MKTTHQIFFADAQKMEDIGNESIDLMITSPPYPMVEMWDKNFIHQNPKILKALDSSDGSTAFEIMHQILDRVWDEVWRVLKPGAIACINIGDAARTIDTDFLYFPITPGFNLICFIWDFLRCLVFYGENRPMLQISLWDQE
jgi:modification methylase